LFPFAIATAAESLRLYAGEMIPYLHDIDKSGRCPSHEALERD